MGNANSANNNGDYQKSTIGDGGFGGLATGVKNEGGDDASIGFEFFNSNSTNSNPSNLKINTLSSSLLNSKFFSPEILKLLNGGDPLLSFRGEDENLIGKANIAKECEKRDNSWILDCGANDTMTFESSDFMSKYKPIKTHIQTADGVLYI